MIRVEKSHDPSSESWRSKKVSGIIQSEFKDLKARSPDV